MTPLDQALLYAQKHSWPVFPVSWDGKKIPLIKGWPTEADSDPEKISTWWQRWPQAFIGFSCGKAGLVVLDIDVKEGRNGFWTLADYYCLYDLPETPMAFTRSDGLHVYFEANPEIEIRNSGGKKGLGPGLDIRGNGGFVVLPCPGSGYRWHSTLNFNNITPIIAPARLGRRVKQSSPTIGNGRWLDAEAILETACSNIRRAGPGERHDTLNREVFSIAGLAASGALIEDEARHALAAAALTMVSGTGGDRKKAEKDFDDAWRAGLSNPRRTRR